MPIHPEPGTARDTPNSPPSAPAPQANPPTFGYSPPDYRPPGYPPSSPPPLAGYGPPGYQGAPDYGGPYYPPVPPEYRQPHPGGYPQAGYSGGGVQQPETNTLAIASLVASLVGMLCIVGSIVGIVLGAVAANQIKQTREPGYGLAVAAIVVGVASLVVFLILAITFRMH